MIRQHYAHRGRPNGRGGLIGPVSAGAILYLQDGPEPRFREPWIIEGWLPREIFRGGGVNGIGHAPTRPARMRGGHLAICRSLRTGARRTVAEQYIYAAHDAGWEIP